MQTALTTSSTTTNPNLLVFFNGWGMTSAAVEHLVLPEGFDLMVVYDYRTLSLLPLTTQNYSSYSIVAWSTGVWAAEQLNKNHFLPSATINKAIAIAGSPFIRHDSFGIPTKVFDLTLQNLTNTSRELFNRRMCGGKTLQHLYNDLRSRTTEELREELTTVRQTELNRTNQNITLLWDGIIIAEKDKIIPAKNLKQFAEQYHIPYQIIQQGQHYLFGEYTNWQQILSLF